MASRKPKPIEIKSGESHSSKPISINPNATHKPEDDSDYNQYDGQGLEDGQDPIEQTLEEARAEDAASAAADATASDANAPANSDQEPNNSPGTSAPTRIKLKWAEPMQNAAIAAIYDYRESAGAMPSILDLFEILQGDEAFAHLDGKLNHKGTPVFSPQSLQAGVNAIRKQIAKDIAAEIKLHGGTDLSPLPSLARVQTVRTQKVTDARALGRLVAQREAKLAAAREEELKSMAMEEQGYIES